MKNSINELLSELYLLDPELKKQEKELKSILQKMIQNKPETQFDSAFKDELKARLAREIALSKKTGIKVDWKSILVGFLVGGSAIGFAGFAFVQVLMPIQNTGNIAGTTAMEAGMKNTDSTVQSPGLIAMAPIDFGFKKSEKGSAAFGSLSSFESSAANGASSPREVTGVGMAARDVSTTRSNPVAAVGSLPREGVAAGIAAPAVAPVAATPEIAIAPASEGQVNTKMVSPDARIMIAPFEQKVYNYVYSGSGFSIDQKEMAVLQKKKNTLSSKDAQGILKNFSLSNIQLGSFSSMSIGSMNLVEDAEFGLSLSMDFYEGAISISKNWSKWPQENCMNGACSMTKIEDIPSDDWAIETANAFFKKHGISLDSYGKPIVNNDWRKEYDRAVDKSTAWVPNAVTVVYPLVVEGKEVFEEYGQPKGITVSIDVKTSLVTDVYGIEKLDFDASNYATETNVEKILEVAKNGGRSWGYPVRNYMPDSTSSNSASSDSSGIAGITKVDVRLGEPKMSYVRLNDYQSGVNKEYLVPALVFPVLDTPKDGEYFQNTVIVPVIQDFFTRNEGSIMPMIKAR